MLTSPKEKDAIVAVIPFPNLTSTVDGLITVANATSITGLILTENEGKAATEKLKKFRQI